MSPHSSTLLKAVVIGALLMSVSTAGAYVANSAGAELATKLLSWPNTLLQNTIPCVDIGSAERPLCEGTPLNFVAYLVSLFLGATVYAAIAYFWLLRRRPSPD